VNFEYKGPSDEGAPASESVQPRVASTPKVKSTSFALAMHPFDASLLFILGSGFRLFL